LFRQLIDLRFLPEHLFNRRDQILQLNRLALAQIENVEHRSLVLQRRHRSLNDVVDVSVIATRASVAELVDRVARVSFFCELMDREIRSLSRAVNGEVTQRNDPQRSEERRVGKESRSRWSPNHQ